MKKAFMICVCNERYEASLERMKVYEVLPDRNAQRHGQTRIIDESGEDYLYPEDYFSPLELPAKTVEKLEVLIGV